MTQVNVDTDIESTETPNGAQASTGSSLVVEPRLLNRELANLDFQERVFALAESRDRPLLERVKFVAIVSSNLDEFFQVRVAGLLEQADSGITKTSPDGMSPREQLEGIRSQVIDLNNRIDALVNDEIRPALEDAGIRVVGYDDLSNLDRQRLNGTFEENIFPVLTPLAVDPTHPFPFISDLSLNLAVLLRAGDDGDLQFARVKIPPNVPRFIAIDDDGSRFVPLEQVVGHHLGRLFGGLDVVDYYAFRVTRSADLDVEEEEADDLLAAMESVLRYRHRAAHAVRLEVEAGIDDNVLKLLLHGLQLTPNEVYHRHGPLGLAGLWAAYALDRPDLKDKPAEPSRRPGFWRRVRTALSRLGREQRS